MRPPTNQPANQHLSALTGLRIFAALHVVLYHFALELFAEGPVWLSNLVHAGYIGVSLFYILSGFILTYVYLDLTGKRQVKSRSFWIARFARVYPVYFVGLIILAPIFFEQIQDGTLTRLTAVMTSISHPLAIQAWFPNTACQWNCPAWSVSVEAFFYFTYPFIATAVLPRIDTRNVSRAILILAGLWLLSLVPPSIFHYFDRTQGISADKMYWLDILKFNPLVRFPEFLFGIVLGKLFLTNAAQDKFGEKWATPFSLLALAGLTAALIFSSQIPYALLHNGLLAPFYALLIYGLALGRGPLVWLLSLAPIVFLGEASYALYILHAPIWVWMYRAQLALGLGIDVAHSVTYFLVYLGVMFAASIAMFKLVELPARDLIRRVFSGKPAKTAVQPSESAASVAATVPREPTAAPEPVLAQPVHLRESRTWLMPTLGALVAGVIIGLAASSYVLGRSLPTAAAMGDGAPEGGELISAERFASGIEGSGWQSISGTWTFENGNVVQRETEGYDHALVFNQNFSEYVLRIGLTQLQGSGGGVLFNLPEVDRKNGAHMVRYTDEGNGVFWGHYDEDGNFVGQGFAPTLPAEKKTSHVLEVVVGSDTYTVRLDGRVLGQDVPLVSKAGHVGLTSSVSAVAFDSATVLGPGGEPLTTSPGTDNGGSADPALAATEGPDVEGAVPADGNLLSTLTDGNDLEAGGWTPFSGEWAFQDGALTQSQREGFDRGIGYQSTFSNYTLTTTLRHLEGTGGGLFFNMPQPDRKNGAHMVRFSDDGKAVFWGYYDQNGDFTGQGSADIATPGTGPHTIGVSVGAENYTVRVDDQTMAENIPLQSKQGHIGLTSSESVVAFERVQVEPAE